MPSRRLTDRLSFKFLLTQQVGSQNIAVSSTVVNCHSESQDSVDNLMKLLVLAFRIDLKSKHFTIMLLWQTC